MPTTSKSFATSKSRYTRYQPIIAFVTEQQNFDLAAVKSHCAEEQPAFVTRVVNDLVKEGWIIRENASSKSYVWNPDKTFVPKKWLDDKLFGTQIKESPEQDRPRERLLRLGAHQLRNSELLAILIRSGRPGESAVMGGEKVARAFDGRLEELAAAGRGELKEITIAVEKTAYCQIMAGIELGRRVAALSDDRITHKISSSADAMSFCKNKFSRLASDGKQEEFHIISLDTKNQVIDTHLITIGTLDASLVHPREVFKPAIKDSASSIILVHNHPSGDPTPSREDNAVTDRLTECGKTLGIDVLDHIIVAGTTALSIRESN